MAKKEELIVLSKADICDPDMLTEMVSYFEKNTGKKVALTISAGAYIRTDDLKDLLLTKIPEDKTLPKEVGEDSEGYLVEDAETNVKVYDLKRKADPKRCHITKRDDGDYEVT